LRLQPALFPWPPGSPGVAATAAGGGLLLPRIVRVLVLGRFSPTMGTAPSARSIADSTLAVIRLIRYSSCTHNTTQQQAAGSKQQNHNDTKQPGHLAASTIRFGKCIKGFWHGVTFVVVSRCRGSFHLDELISN
jgi:hypothetical protein